VVYEATARCAATAVSGVIWLRRLRNKDNVMMGNVTTVLQVNATIGNGITPMVLPEPRLVTLYRMKIAYGVAK
jgi:hypothetical protein